MTLNTSKLKSLEFTSIMNLDLGLEKLCQINYI